MSCSFCAGATSSFPCPACSPMPPTWEAVAAALPKRRRSRSSGTKTPRTQRAAPAQTPRRKAATPRPRTAQPGVPTIPNPSVPLCGLRHPTLAHVGCNLHAGHLGDECLGQGFTWPKLRPAVAAVRPAAGGQARPVAVRDGDAGVRAVAPAPAPVLSAPPVRKDGAPAQVPAEDETTQPDVPPCSGTCDLGLGQPAPCALDMGHGGACRPYRIHQPAPAPAPARQPPPVAARPPPVVTALSRIPFAHHARLLAMVRQALAKGAPAVNEAIAMMTQLGDEAKRAERFQVMAAIEARTVNGRCSPADDAKRQAIYAEIVLEIGVDPREPPAPPPPATVDGGALLEELLDSIPTVKA